MVLYNTFIVSLEEFSSWLLSTEVYTEPIGALELATELQQVRYLQLLAQLCYQLLEAMWVVVKIMVPFWVLSIIRHLVLRGPKRGPQFQQPSMCDVSGPSASQRASLGHGGT